MAYIQILHKIRTPVANSKQGGTLEAIFQFLSTSSHFRMEYHGSVHMIFCIKTQGTRRTSFSLVLFSR
jgi:hypothetical protein